jgi:hypothetical protein
MSYDTERILTLAIVFTLLGAGVWVGMSGNRHLAMLFDVLILAVFLFLFLRSKKRGAPPR